MPSYSVILLRSLRSNSIKSLNMYLPARFFSSSFYKPSGGCPNASNVSRAASTPHTNYNEPRRISLVDNRISKRRLVSSECLLQVSNYGRLAYRHYRSEDEESDYEVTSSHQSMSDSTLDNIDDWRSRLARFAGKHDEQEIVSREKKDRRDFEQLNALATRMGFHCRQYERVVVVSKIPLPNYRSDLDDKRPLREVVLPYGLEEQVDFHVESYVSQKPKMMGAFTENSRSNLFGKKELTYDDIQPQSSSGFMDKFLLRKSLQLRAKQQEWHSSIEGQAILKFRESLPAFKEKDILLKAIRENQVVVVSGETGCGKTTQLPQFILESEIEAARGATCGIICTQPRRISAISVSERVAAERGEQIGESVGYKVRLEGAKGRDTRLLFCTTGVLLRRLLVDRNLKDVSHVIVDEIHERGMNEDFLLIILKDLLPRRPDLRIILMSATMNAKLFSSYFNDAPMIHIPGFTYPVRSHFLENILEMIGYRLTPYNQIDDYGQDKAWKMQKQAHLFRRRKSQIASSVEEALEEADFRDYSRHTQESLSCWNPDSIGFNLIENVLCHIVTKGRPGAVLVFMTGWDDINTLKDQLQAHPLLGDPSKTLLLACHGSMASSEQKLIFDKPEGGVRKIVLATNMAETSITINDVVFVVDCGKAKETSYDALNNTPCLLPSWISKAAARQRKGRAGRVQPGECFHLYPRCVYEAFADYQLPELLRTPLQSLCLQIKSLRLGDISQFLSRALEPPEALSVQNAVDYLKIIGALDENEEMTVLGKHLSLLPVEPKLGKMLLFGAIFNCLDPIMTVVAGLSVRDPFLMPFDKKDLAEAAKAQFSGNGYSDHIALINAYEDWREAESQQSGYEFCWKNFISHQTMKAIHSLRKQFLNLLKDTGLVHNTKDDNTNHNADKHFVRAIICAGLFPGICSVVNKEKSISIKTMEDGQVLLYSSSVNGSVPKIPYPWLVFNEKVKVNSVFLRDSSGVSDSILLLFGGRISQGGLDGHLKLMDGYMEFFMKPAVAKMFVGLKQELDDLIQSKLVDPKLEMQAFDELMVATRLLISSDRCEGKFVYGIPKSGSQPIGIENSKNELQTLMTRAGRGYPIYKTKALSNSKFRCTVHLNGMKFSGQVCGAKKLAEKYAAAAALQCLTSGTNIGGKYIKDDEDDQSDRLVDNAKNELQSALQRAGHRPPSYHTRTAVNNAGFVSSVLFNGMRFHGHISNTKKAAEKSAASQALLWLHAPDKSSFCKSPSYQT